MSRKPLAWSYSALADFINCPRAYYEKRVAKSVQEATSEQLIWGNKVHKAFENRQQHGTKLPANLAEHEEYMQRLEAIPGTLFAEQKIALNKSLKPCGFFDKDVWWRGVIDWRKVDGERAWMVDYKTGKKKPDFKQLGMFAIHTFLSFPDVKTIEVKFYWTQTKDESPATYRRSEMDNLWALFSGDLRQYMEAFQSDIWQPRQSGLCNGWCPVTSCEFWKPKRT